MHLRRFAGLAAVLAGAAFFTIIAQGPMYDKVFVNLPYQVTIKDVVLEPGEYEIRQMSGQSNSRILHIYKDGGMKLETSAMTIPALENKTPEDTKILLHQIADRYYFDKIWIQGKNYGYEFVLPDSVKALQKETQTVSARYESAPAPPSVTAQAEQKDADAEKERLAAAERQAKADRDAQAERDRLAAAERDRQAQAERDLQAQRQREEQERVAQVERERQAAADRERAALAARPAPADPAPASAQEELPQTASNWLFSLIGGGLMAAAGLRLRR